MKPITRTIGKAALIGFLLMVILAFTPLSFLPKLFSLAVGMGLEGDWLAGLVLVLVVAGMPFGGFLWALLFSRSDQHISSVASVAGLWIGTFAGSWTGTKILEVS